MYRCTGAQVYRCTGVQVYRYTGVQVYRCTGVQVYRCTGVQVIPARSKSLKLQELIPVSRWKLGNNFLDTFVMSWSKKLVQPKT